MSLTHRFRNLTLLRQWRWDLIGIGAVSLLLWFAALIPGAYFLQIDTAAHDYAALAWVAGCWDFITEKYLSVWLLAISYWLFDPSPYWGTFWLTIAAVASSVLAYMLGQSVGNSRLAGVLAALMLLALPGYQFFNRTYFGYLFPFMLLGWLAILRDRWWWAGLCFGLAIQGHFNSLVPVAISCVTAFIVLFRQARWQSWPALAAGLLVPWLVSEFLFFFYWGPGSFPLYTRSVLNVIIHTNVGYLIPPGVTWVPRAIVGTDGWLAIILFVPGLFAPYLLRHNRKHLAMAISFVGIAVLYTLQATFTHAIVVPRMLMSSIPFWCILAAAVWVALLNRIEVYSVRRTAVAGFLLLLAISVGQTHLFIREFSRTPYLAIDEWFSRARQANRPVRYQGNIRIGMFYAYLYGVETLVNDRRWIETNTPGQAILIFTAKIPENLSQTGYTITAVEQPTSTDVLYPVLTREAGTPRHIELWWPSGKSQPVKPDTASPFTGLDATAYYPGSGCMSAPTYMYGTMWFYQLVIHKIREQLGQN